jgi:hypothetical protein
MNDKRISQLYHATGCWHQRFAISIKQLVCQSEKHLITGGPLLAKKTLIRPN